MKIQTIGIIGTGAFGQFVGDVLAKHLPDVEIKFSSTSQKVDNKKIFAVEEVCSSDILIPCVPIANFEETIEKALPHLGQDTLIFEVCSVKTWPKKVLTELLTEDQEYILTHPMFGPESYRNNSNSVEGFNLVFERGSCPEDKLEVILNFLGKDLKLNLIEMSADQHDREASQFHFVTMFVALMSKKLQFERSEIATESAKRMHEFVDRVGDDYEILRDMYRFNPYCKKQLEKIEEAFGEVKGVLNYE